MALVNLSTVLQQAVQHGCAVGCFNMVDINSLEAIINGAVKLNSPVIVSVAEIHFPYVDIERYASVICHIANQASVPVVLHLDHGQTLEAIMKAIRHGFTSVMFDGSRLPLAENTARTAEIVRFAHAAGVSVEAELGHVGGAEGLLTDNACHTDFFTDPVQAATFVKSTGVDALAVAVGSAHGVYKQKPQLDFQRLVKIKELTQLPLVLHGGSGLGDEDFRRSIECGIHKINVYTDLSVQANKAIKEALNKNPGLPYPEIKAVARQAMEKVVIEKIKVFNSV
ncbi:class II fructose-bisphosphate aldolase [Desulforamulus hydrothermalis]|uniref:Putative aldolase n=1 Tax=Desulforamulus hydrothermalis Lam5 = DSM 18033 TaxID=1121428 RepID=K8EJT7_9FIRM|nr:class II fructose-bisphosphate aldolase [Desulforamulus hydrothermalis]CCO08826.1 putative aldolase [Desulforamulus hydrothermalis Lam5 = DSM 18033]SHG72529.1 fructose-bisphosphate aldolase, class II [Desulforamulus hydrothermalis Lam5 = DSM 18033]